MNFNKLSKYERQVKPSLCGTLMICATTKIWKGVFKKTKQGITIPLFGWSPFSLQHFYVIYGKTFEIFSSNQAFISTKLLVVVIYKYFYLLLIIEKAIVIDFYKKLKYFGWWQYKFFLMNFKRVTNNDNLAAAVENIDGA